MFPGHFRRLGLQVNDQATKTKAESNEGITQRYKCSATEEA
jgi:hypothetical protein